MLARMVKSRPAQDCDEDKAMKRYLTRVLLAVALCTTLGIAQADDTILRLSTGIRPPLVDGDNARGFAEAVAKEAFRRAGVKLSVAVYPSKLASINSSSGITDGELLRIEEYGASYPELIRVEEPLMMIEFVAYSLTELGEIKQWSDLSERHLAYVNGWKVFENSIGANDKVVKVDDPVKLFRLLKERRTEVVLYEKWQGLVLAKQSGVKSINVSRLPTKENAMFIYLHKRHRELVPLVMRALRSMKEDGTYQRIYNETLNVLLDSAKK